MIDHTEYAQNARPVSPRPVGIDFLCVVAILWVMAYHLHGRDRGLPAWTDDGWMGVDRFLC